MINLIKRLTLAVIVLSAAFLWISVEDGGKAIRNLGSFFKSGSDEAAKTADSIHKSSNVIVKSTTDVVQSVRKTGKEIAHTTTNTSEKITAQVKKTGGEMLTTTKKVGSDTKKALTLSRAGDEKKAND